VSGGERWVVWLTAGLGGGRTYQAGGGAGCDDGFGEGGCHVGGGDVLELCKWVR
jgi:hypothetical protein